MTYACFKLDALTPSLWRATFSNPPINLIDVRIGARRVIGPSGHCDLTRDS
jgi:hypothetical protein